MTPEQKLKWAIIAKFANWSETPAPEYPCNNVDEIYAALVERGEHWDVKNEVRSGRVETGLPVPFSRHYEGDAVAMQMPDGTWVGWTYWHGGGKFGEPEAIDWMEDAYEVACVEEEKVVIVRTFTAPSAS